MKKTMQERINEEIAKREKFQSRIDREIARREEKAGHDARVTSFPEIEEAEHPNISLTDRAKVKNLAANNAEGIKYLKKQHPGLDFREFDDRILIKDKNATKWNVLDPDADGIDGIKEFGKDMLDIAWDVPAGVIEGAASAAAAVAALPSSPIGSVAAAIGANAAAGGAIETARQGVGRYFDVNEELDGYEIGKNAAISGLTPMVPGAIVKTAKGGKGLTKLVAKKWSGASEDQIQAMQEEGAEEIIKRIEKETYLPTVKKVGDSYRNLGEKIRRRVNKDKESVKESIKLDSDRDIQKVISAEIEAERLSEVPNLKRIDELKEQLKMLPETKQARMAMSKTGSSAVGDIVPVAYPNAIDIESAAEELPGVMKSSFMDAFNEIGKKYDMALDGVEVDPRVIDEVEKEWLSKLSKAGGSKADTRTLEMAKKFFNENFKVHNPNAKQTLSDGLAGISRNLDEYIPHSEKGPMLVKKAQELKRTAKEYSDFNKNPNSAGIEPTSAGVITNIARDLNSGLSAAIDRAAEGQFGRLSPEYKEAIQLRNQFGKLFDTEEKAATTINKMLSDKPAGRILRKKMQRIDQLTGNNFVEQIDLAIKANKEAKNAVKLSKSIKGYDSYASKTVDDSLSPGSKAALEIAKRNKTNVDTERFLLNYKNKESEILKDQHKELVKEFGSEIAEDIDKATKEFDLAAAFGDSSKTKLNEIGKGEAENAARGGAQAIGWQFGNAGAAQVLGNFGKAIGEKLSGRQLLRKTLPYYARKKEWYKNMDEKTKEELGRKIYKFIKLRDVARQAGKETVKYQFE